MFYTVSQVRFAWTLLLLLLLLNTALAVFVGGTVAGGVGPPTPNATLPFWLLNAPFQNTRTDPLPAAVRSEYNDNDNDSDSTAVVDIIVIGSGSAGASVVYHLSQFLNEPNGHHHHDAEGDDNMNITSVLLLDSRGAAGGASGRNGGAMHVTTDTSFQHTYSTYGNATAISEFNFSAETTANVLELLEDSANASYFASVQNGRRAETFTDASTIISRNASINLMNSFGLGLGEYLYANAIAMQNQDKDTDKDMNINDGSMHGNRSQFENILHFKNASEFIGGIVGPYSYSLNPAFIVFELINKSIHQSNNSLHLDAKNKMHLNINYGTTVHSVQYNESTQLYQLYVSQQQQQPHNDLKNEDAEEEEDDDGDGDLLVEIRSKMVVFATNAYTPYLLPQFTDRIIPIRVQVVLSIENPIGGGRGHEVDVDRQKKKKRKKKKVRRKSSSDEVIWANLTGIMSMANTNTDRSRSRRRGHSGENADQAWRYYTELQTFNNRVIVLGERIDQSWTNNYNDSYVDYNFSLILEQLLVENYAVFADNDGFAFEYEWAGIYGASADGYPYVGPIVNASNAYICAGFGGLGDGLTFNAGKAIASMIVGRSPDPFVDIYLPSARM